MLAVVGATALAVAAQVLPGSAQQPRSPQQWIEEAPGGTPPQARTHHTAVFASQSDRMIVFGGAVLSTVAGNTTPQPKDLRNDVHVLVNATGVVSTDESSLEQLRRRIPRHSPEWRDLNPEGRPPSPRFGHTAVYTPRTNRMVVFGGEASSSGATRGLTPVNDTWVLVNADGTPPNARDFNIPAWFKLVPVDPPPPRVGHSAVYDVRTNRMVIFGGVAAQNVTASAIPLQPTNDVWVLSNADGSEATAPAWTELKPAGPLPPPMLSHTAVYDPQTNHMVVFAGEALKIPGMAKPSTDVEPVPALPFQPTNDVWVLVNANGAERATPTWIHVQAGGTPPPPRFSNSAVYDPLTDRLVVFGGDALPSSVSVTSVPVNDVWVLSGAAGLLPTSSWTQLRPGGALPPPRAGHSAVFGPAPASNRMVIFGGDALAGPTNVSATAIFNDAWTLTNANGLVFFDRFDAQLVLEVGGTGSVEAFQLSGTFVLGTGSNGIDPPTESISLRVGPFEITLPPGSFAGTSPGRFAFHGVVNAAALDMVIQHHGRHLFSFEFRVRGPLSLHEVSGLEHETEVVEYKDGDNVGITSVRPKFHKAKP